MTFTEHEQNYLSSQRLGRLATVGPDSAPHNNPVGFRWNAELGTFDIYGYAMGSSRKFHNVEKNPHVALVVDDIVSFDPWEVRGIEIRGVAQALVDQEPPMDFMSREIIRITPRRVIAWNLDPDDPSMHGRNVPGADGS